MTDANLQQEVAMPLMDGETLVTRWNVCLTSVGFIFYLVDLVSDVGTSVYYAANGQWWRAVATLTIVYGAVIIHTVVKLPNGQMDFTRAAAWLRYVASSLVNRPNLEQYWALCRVEWQLHKLPASSAHLVPEWHGRRWRVAYLKYVEGVCVYVWAVSVTVSRLLSVTLLLSVHLYWGLAGVALHLVLRGVDWCRTEGVPRTLRDVIAICLFTLQFFMSPFSVTDSVTYRRVRHAVHFLVNTGMMVVWALSTLLVCVHPALYTAIICFNAAMFAVGLVAWQLHEYYWPGSYFIEYDG